MSSASTTSWYGACHVNDVSGPGCLSPILPLPVLRIIRHAGCPQVWRSSEQSCYEGGEEDQPSGGRASRDGGNSLQPDASGAVVEDRQSVRHMRFPHAWQISEQSCYQGGEDDQPSCGRAGRDGGKSLQPNASGGVAEAVTTDQFSRWRNAAVYTKGMGRAEAAGSNYSEGGGNDDSHGEYQEEYSRLAEMAVGVYRGPGCPSLVPQRPQPPAGPVCKPVGRVTQQNGT